MFFLSCNTRCIVEQLAQHSGGKAAGAKAKTQADRTTGFDPLERKITHCDSQRTSRRIEPITEQTRGQRRKLRGDIRLERGNLTADTILTATE